MKNYGNLFLGLMFLTLIFASCSEDNDGPRQTENAKVYITDAPIDNANVKAAYVTVTDVKIDGKSINGFSATTINLLAYQNGNTKLLGNLDLSSRTYSNLTLVLDYNSNVDGNAPGCYVEMVDGTKHKLEAVSNEVSVNDSFEVIANATNKIVIDFDLRKTIKEEQGNASSSFNFVSMSELKSGIRVVNEETTGSISGTATDTQSTSEKIIVYAYKKGQFNAQKETQGQGESNITFAGAVCSAEVNKLNGSYSLNFLEEGEYELHYASYTDNDQDNKYEFSSMLEAESVTNIDLGSITVSSGIQISANVTIKGTL
jgi:hypothetical protein